MCDLVHHHGRKTTAKIGSEMTRVRENETMRIDGNIGSRSIMILGMSIIGRRIMCRQASAAMNGRLGCLHDDGFQQKHT
jgi:hypothetical protein